MSVLMSGLAGETERTAALEGDIQATRNTVSYRLRGESKRWEVLLNLSSGKRTVKEIPFIPVQENDTFARKEIHSDRYRAVIRYDLIPKTSMNNILYVELYHRKPAPLITRHRFAVVDPAASEVHFVGENLYLMDCVGAGPGCTGKIIDPESGRQLQRLQTGPEEGLNVYNTNFVRLHSGHYVFFDSTGTKGILYNGAGVEVLLFNMEADVEQGVRAASPEPEKLIIVYGSAGEKPAGRALLYDIRQKKTIKIYNL
ncbi:MAG: hypothetical protein HS115_13465 [Spirochaetales bacterium]|nr:hypothetical protein [Spirochaetales bacterium]